MPRVLLIDDDEDVRDAVQKILVRSGYEVASVSSGEEGLRIAESRSFDLVIVDIIMPGINGVDAIKRIRTLQPNVRILAISGGGNFGLANYRPDAISTSAYLQAAAHAGADEILTKPFEKRELLESVGHLTDCQRR